LQGRIGKNRNFDCLLYYETLSIHIYGSNWISPHHETRISCRTSAAILSIVRMCNQCDCSMEPKLWQAGLATSSNFTARPRAHSASNQDASLPLDMSSTVPVPVQPNKREIFYSQLPDNLRVSRFLLNNSGNSTTRQCDHSRNIISKFVLEQPIFSYSSAASTHSTTKIYAKIIH
jgi:hypothetical protein